VTRGLSAGCDWLVVIG